MFFCALVEFGEKGALAIWASMISQSCYVLMAIDGPEWDIQHLNRVKVSLLEPTRKEYSGLKMFIWRSRISFIYIYLYVPIESSCHRIIGDGERFLTSHGIYVLVLDLSAWRDATPLDAHQWKGKGVGFGGFWVKGDKHFRCLVGDWRFGKPNKDW